MGAFERGGSERWATAPSACQGPILKRCLPTVIVSRVNICRGCLLVEPADSRSWPRITPGSARTESDPPPGEYGYRFAAGGAAVALAVALGE